MVGLSRFELLTSRLSGVRSDQLSYRPLLFLNKYNPQSLKDLFYFHIILLSMFFQKYDVRCKFKSLSKIFLLPISYLLLLYILFIEGMKTFKIKQQAHVLSLERR